MFNSGPCPAAQPNIICHFGTISVGFWWFTRIFLLFDVCWQKICSSLNRKKKRKISENQNSAWKGHTLAFSLGEDPICILFNYWKPHIFSIIEKLCMGQASVKPLFEISIYVEIQNQYLCNPLYSNTHQKIFLLWKRSPVTMFWWNDWNWKCYFSSSTLLSKNSPIIDDDIYNT